MKKIYLRTSSLQILYLIIFAILFSIIIYTPTLIKGPVHLTAKFIIEEETIEGSLLCILLIMGVLILNLFKQEVDKQKELISKINSEKKKVEGRLTNSEQYIGITNVQIQEIKYIFNSTEKLPETKDDLKKTLGFFGGRVIGIVNSDWVLFRIIDKNTSRTICEHLAIRPGFSDSYPHVSNKMIIEKRPVLPLVYISSNPKNLNILAVCIMPVDSISNDQHAFFQAIINEITKLYIIQNSFFNHKNNSISLADYS